MKPVTGIDGTLNYDVCYKSETRHYVRADQEIIIDLVKSSGEVGAGPFFVWFSGVFGSFRAVFV